MWQEAKKQEKHIRSVLVDYKKRTERRLQFYSQIVSCHMYIYIRFSDKTRLNLSVFMERPQR